MSQCDSSIVPRGFEPTSHPIFRSWEPPKFSTEPPQEPPSRVRKLSRLVVSTECPICLNVLNDPVTVLGCRHNFCHGCLSNWLYVADSCPLCKSGVRRFLLMKLDDSTQTLFTERGASEVTAEELEEAVSTQASVLQLLSKRETPNAKGGLQNNTNEGPNGKRIRSTDSAAEEGTDCSQESVPHIYLPPNEQPVTETEPARYRRPTTETETERDRQPAEATEPAQEKEPSAEAELL
uniref:RING-type domain-containing protein n=1 Tax=Octactis speculum TaxID=3111310 RepID=A0A6U3S2Q2_9STRA|mmetsp:Transcript_27090/g.37175  ORF Transcript_27090/g.37175 Transcript_27090/m.37175 type:complete len:236 (+) Transcript_27090:162-869(+)|eukprot:CAMPEP_0185767866 /NCGR_PEP_ID=MMETSP1174-20130828/45611_1 /TAXON_ID=35687 /ORGANISM="Dictyocha speculum, Strain CCMP1381" /LENGTH=235 /DNA_ID=CAMNT_0028452237 /DNA_START=83 /DNA_END=790 /DNA_ORIENTATION=-